MAVCYFLDKRCAILLTAPGTFEDVTDFRFVPRDGHVERARLQRPARIGVFRLTVSQENSSNAYTA